MSTSDPTKNPFEPFPSSSTPSSLISSALHTALRLPSTNPWVAHWLFHQLTQCPYHRSISVPPSHFSLCLGVGAENSVCSPNTDDTAPLPPTRCSAQMLFTPISSCAGVVVGYVFSPSTDQVARAFPPLSETSPLTPPFTGRFAFDIHNRDMVFVVHGGNPKVIAIRSFAVSKTSVREQSSIVVPSANYDFYNLPSTVLSMLSNVEYRLEHIAATQGGPVVSFANSKRGISNKPPKPPRIQKKGDITDSQTSWLSDLLASDGDSFPMDTEIPHDWRDIQHLDREKGKQIDPRIFCASHMPWFVAEDGQLADGTGYAMAGFGQGDTSGGAFDAVNLRSAMTEMATELLGKYCGPSVRMDSLHALTGQYSSMFTGSVRYVIDGLMGKEMVNVKAAFAQNYYTSVLSVSCDNSLISAAVAPEDRHGMVVHNNTDEIVDSNVRDVGDELNKLQSAHPWLLRTKHTSSPEERSTKRGRTLRKSRFTESMSNVRSQMQTYKMQGGKGSTSPEQDMQDDAQRLAGSRLPAPRSIAPRLTVQSVDSTGLNDEKVEMYAVKTIDQQKCTARQHRLSPEEEKARKARLLEERKKRNRLSAARSNHRKKEKIEEMKREIEENRAITTQLLERRKAFEIENDKLKQLINLNSQQSHGRSMLERSECQNG